MKGSPEMFEKKRIESFEKVTLHISGMRCSSEYEIVNDSGSAMGFIRCFTRRTETAFPKNRRSVP